MAGLYGLAGSDDCAQSGAVAIVWQLAMELTGLTRRCSEPRPAPMRNFNVDSSSSLQRRALSGAVADLVSR